MDPLTAGIISGGVGAIGGYLQNEGMSSNADKQMHFQRGMSDTAHQREVADLRAAGLNPLLSALGSGAPSAPGAMANVSNMGEGLSKGIDTAIAIRAQNKELESRDAQIGNLKADTANKAATAGLIRSQTIQTAADARNKTYQNVLFDKTLDAQAKKLMNEGKYSEAKEIMGLINSGASSAGQLLGGGALLQIPKLLQSFKKSPQLKLPGMK